MTETPPLSTDRSTGPTDSMSSSKSSASNARAKTDANRDSETIAVGWKRILYLVSAGIFFLFGALGALLPALPATPFLLLTSYFLVKSSPRLNAVLLRSRLFGPILTDWQEYGGVRYGVKLKAVCVVLIAVGLTTYLTGFKPLPTLVVSIGAAIGILVIMRLPTAGE